MQKNHCDHCDEVIHYQDRVDVELKMGSYRFRGGSIRNDFTQKLCFCSEPCVLAGIKDELEKRYKHPPGETPGKPNGQVSHPERNPKAVGEVGG